MKNYVKNIISKITALAKRLPVLIKEAPGKIKAAYKKWLYAEKKESPAPRRTAALIISGVLILFALYYIGVFEFDLFDRPESWQENPERLFSIWNKDGGEGSEAEPEETKSAEPDAPDPEPEHIQTVELEFKGRSRRNNGAGISTVFKTREELAAEGYYLTDATFNSENSVIGKIGFSFSFPSEFSYRDMKTRYWEITKYDDGRMSEVEDTVRTVERPALYLYMGYVIYDDSGKALYLMDRNGAVLMNYNENYLPAFARDRNGNPLFYSTYGYYADVPATHEVNEAGEDSFTYKGAYLTGYNYYTLSYGGNYFVGSDYIEERDGRGLNFDFPASYSLSDAYLYRVGIMSPKYSSFLNGKSAYVNFMSWNFFSPNDPARPKLDEIIAKEKEYALLTTEEKLKAIKEKKTPEDEYKISELLPYYAAFNYNEGYATVVTDKVDEEAKYEVKELRVINTAGNVMFNSMKKYQNKILGAYCSDRFMLPLSKGEESIGQIYFDHGLMRLRKVSYDPFQLNEFGVFRVNMDADVLVYPNGNEFPIPEGYTLKGYADGILTLERGGVYGYMNNEGKWIADPIYSSASAFHGGIGVLTREDGATGAIDTNGTIIIPFRYDYISNRSDELIAAYSESSGWELFGVFAK